ncbi:MAG: flagellar hook-basal body complex protein [Clostridium sp.]|uniref:flagellar hook-basal body complex protein n=1 Tax=Clostridium TaxID=1485 RepID=UPI002152D3A6|nr:flagellar hook-basal body complex protein [Clostridium sp. LY3-2]MCR6513537.1 flagellar basal body rod protein FlgG [Clostridium sp. LY3-2]
MLRSLFTSKSGMYAQQNKLDSISNNLANSTTMGYKRVDVGFKDLLSESLDRKGTPLNDKESIMGTGVRTTDYFRDNSQGMLQQTMRSTDLSIDGEGYFRIDTPDGKALYTRDGSFKIDARGRLVDGRGNKVHMKYEQGYNENNVKLTTSNMLVDNTGAVFVKDNGTFKKVGSIPTYTATGNESFNSVGDNLFEAGNGVRVTETTNNDVYQGLLESSNVDVAQEFTDMILTQRAFQLSSKSLQTSDDMWGMINNMRSR